MTIEEKAKAYDEAVNKLRRFMAQGVEPLITRADVQDFFPELAENEDEKIRKVIRGWIYTRPTSFFDNGISKEEILAWLEKQGKHEYTLKSSNDEDVSKLTEYITKLAKSYELNLPNRGYDIYAFAKDILTWLEKQGKKSPFNKERLMEVAKPEKEEEKDKPLDAAENLAKAVANAHPSFNFEFKVPDE